MYGVGVKVQSGRKTKTKVGIPLPLHPSSQFHTPPFLASAVAEWFWVQLRLPVRSQVKVKLPGHFGFYNMLPLFQIYQQKKE